MDHGQQLAEDSLKKNPAKFITLINACCNMSNANIAIQNQKMKAAPPRNLKPGPWPNRTYPNPKNFIFFAQNPVNSVKKRLKSFPAIHYTGNLPRRRYGP